MTTGTIVTIPEGQSLFSVATPQGTYFVLAESASHATATMLRAEVPVMGAVPVR